MHLAHSCCLSVRACVCALVCDMCIVEKCNACWRRKVEDVQFFTAVSRWDAGAILPNVKDLMPQTDVNHPQVLPLDHTLLDHGHGQEQW